MAHLQPSFLKLCSISTAAKVAIFFDLIGSGALLTSKLLFTKPIVENNVFQIIISAYATAIFFVGVPIIFNRRKTLLQIFILLASLALLLNIMAWIIVMLQTSKMSLYEALCDTPGDCPKYFNPNYVIGVVLSVVYAALCLLNGLFLTCYMQYLRYLERRKREAEQRKQVFEGVTTDVQTSDPGTPRSTQSRRSSIFSGKSRSRSQLSQSQSRNNI